MQVYSDTLKDVGTVVLPEALYKPLNTINSEEEYQNALEISEKLASTIKDQQHPLFGLLNAILHNITVYEDNHYPMKAVSPAEVLEFLMEQRGMEQAELAQLMGVHQSTVSRLVNGKITFDVATLTVLSKIFSVSVATFLNEA